MANEKKPKQAGGTDQGLQVTSRPASFRRAGFVFTAEARVIPLSDLTEEQVAQIQADPNLVSQVVKLEPPLDK